MVGILSKKKLKITSIGISKKSLQVNDIGSPFLQEIKSELLALAKARLVEPSYAINI